MKLFLVNHLSLAAAIALLIPTAMLAQQQISYLDENYKPATAASYKFKRVLKYLGPKLNQNLGVGYYGGLTSHPTETGIETCSLTDYFKNGAIALVGNVISLTKDCKEPQYVGQVVAYYPDGHIRERAYYNAGRLQGDHITYNEDGSIKSTDHYENGSKLDTKSFAVASNNPLVGTWKSVKYAERHVQGMQPFVNETITCVFSENGTLEANRVTAFHQTSARANWKYIPKSATAGVLEEYSGTDLLSRGDITWVNRNKLEYVLTFSSQDLDKVGSHVTWERQ